MFLAEELTMRAAALRRLPTLALLVAVGAAGGCAPRFESTRTVPITAEDLASFWEDVDPRSRDLYHSVGGAGLQPHPDVVYEVLKRDTGGFSTTFDVRDPRGITWGVKVGDEAQSEVTSSRIVWAAGYRQPPTYYLPRWRARQDGREIDMGPGRFRPKLDDLDSEGYWSWRRNPFVGTQAFRGLIVLMMVLNSTDLKDDNNGIFEVKQDGRLVGRWYVVKDLGATLGTTGVIRPKRSDPEAFERHPFIRDVRDGRVRFHFRGRHRWLVRDVTPADVRWLAGRLARLTDDQWRDAFRAGGYSDEETARFTSRLKEKIDAGHALGSSPAAEE
jgi:hypothetical protein